MIERIKEIIEKEKLQHNCRTRHIVHRRFYLFRLLRKHGVYFRVIGEMFNLNHSTVIHGNSIAEFFERKQDELYLLDTADLQKEFGGIEIIFEPRNLVNDIENCNSMNELSVIKSRLKNNQY